MFHPHHGRTQANAGVRAGLVKSVEIHPAAADRLQRSRPRYGRGEQRLYHVARKAAVAPGKGLQRSLLPVIHRIAAEAEGIGREHVRANAEAIGRAQA